MPTLRQTVLIVALLNLAYFGVEFVAALRAGSVSLLADSADFLEDAAINLLIFFALVWTATRRAKVGKIVNPVPPVASSLTLVGLGALAVNLTAAFLLARHRRTKGSLTRAAFLSARNDAFANIGIIAAGLITARHPSIWPDILVGLIIAAMNLDAAREVWDAAHNEARDAKA